MSGRSRSSNGRPLAACAPTSSACPTRVRVAGGVYSLVGLLLICACAVASGARPIAEITEWGQRATTTVLEQLGIRRHLPRRRRAPSQATLTRLPAALDGNGRVPVAHKYSRFDFQGRRRMQNARELLLAYTGNINDPNKAAALFAAEGAIELPYLDSIGLPSRVEGPAAIRELITGLLTVVPDFGFDHVEILIETPDQVFGEWSLERTTTTGRTFSQLYAGRLVAENGQIKLLRESLDLVRAARAMLPEGLASIPPSRY